ncbi:MAG: hypothetical protein OXR84_16700 [Magnetovibrio sp.]|nr:hypothetical protein [Magnetovibrio sp.]
MAKEDYLRRSPTRFDDPDYQSCYEHWLTIKGEGWAPAWRDWQWMALPLDLIPYFLVVDVIDDPPDFVYRFWGSAYVNMHGIDMTGRSVNEIRSPVTARNTFEQYAEVVACREAIGAVYAIQTGEHEIQHVQTSLRMPMSNDGRRVDHIVTYSDWRADEDEIRDEHIRIYGK